MIAYQKLRNNAIQEKAMRIYGEILIVTVLSRFWHFILRKKQTILGVRTWPYVDTGRTGDESSPQRYGRCGGDGLVVIDGKKVQEEIHCLESGARNALCKSFIANHPG